MKIPAQFAVQILFLGALALALAPCTQSQLRGQNPHPALKAARGAERSQAMKVSSDFPGGGAVVVASDAGEQTLHIQPEAESGRGFPCWWYVRLDGLNPGRTITLTVSSNPKPFNGQRVLGHSWALPDCAAVSVDNVNWTQTPPARREGKSAVYQFPAPAETIWMAWGPPFLPSHADDLLKRAKTKLPSAELFELAESREGRPVRAVRFGAAPSAEKRPFGVWIQARQHAWEAGASWVGQGFLLWAVSDDPAAAQLRRNATIHFVPIMDVDNVAQGFGGKDAIPRDHNRDWDDDPTYPEVRAAQQGILHLHSEGRMDLFIDLHNPAPRDRKPFFFGPDLQSLPSIQHRNYMRWMATAHSLIEDSEPRYRYGNYFKSDEQRSRVSSNWVRRHTSAHVVAATLETAWNRPQGVQQGYQQVGRQLGQAIARYLEVNPRE